MNQELRDMFVADQAERNDHPAYDTPEYWQLRERDAGRRRRVNELLAEGRLTAPEDYFLAALLFQHGETLQDIWQAHELARKAAERGATTSKGVYKDSLGLAAAAPDHVWQAHELARKAAEREAKRSMGYYIDSLGLAAAALDRWLMYQGKPQKYGTQFVPDGKRYRLWDLDPTTTDAERAANHVPSLHEQLKQAERYTQEVPQSGIEKDKAPQWLKEALERWEREDS